MCMCACVHTNECVLRECIPVGSAILINSDKDRADTIYQNTGLSGLCDGHADIFPAHKPHARQDLFTITQIICMNTHVPLTNKNKK